MHIKDFDPFDFNKKEISNVPIYYKNLPWSPCIHIRIVFNSGAFSDPVGKEGVAHFLEHIVYQGSERFGGKKGIKEWSLKKALNSFNAVTSYYTTHYELKCLPQNFNDVVLDLKDIIFNTSFKEDSFDLEKKIIIQEAWGRFQNEKFKSFCLETVTNLSHNTVKERFYTSLGWPETIEKITLEDLKEFYKSNYVKENIFIVVVGDIEENDLDILEKFLKKVPENKDFINNKIDIEKSWNLEKTLKPLKNRIIKDADGIGIVREQAEYDISLSTSDIQLDKYRGTSILFGRFLQNILMEKYRYDNGLCYGISYNSYFSRYNYNIGFNLKLDEKNIDIVEKELENTFKEILNDKYLEKFEDIKQTSIDQIESEEDSSYKIIDIAIKQLMSFSKIFTRAQTLEVIRLVNYSDIKNFLNIILKNRDYVYTEIILPSKKEKEDAKN